jgi:pyruvate/2-oxoglutarate dehydrogenase complex dihydrolipoamide acyltransferase (E2) component
VTSIQMPQLGETIVEGTILKWLKREGDEVTRDEPLFEISTDKVDTEVPSPVAGTVTKILVDEGATVPVGTIVMEVEEAGAPGGSAAGSAGGSAGVATTPAAAVAPVEPRATPAAVPSVQPTPAPVAAVAASSAVTTLPDRGPRSQILSPLVRRLAKEHDLDLTMIPGTGTGGRITKSDVLAVIATGGTGIATAAAPALAQPGLAEPALAEPAPTEPVVAAPEAVAPPVAPAVAPAAVAPAAVAEPVAAASAAIPVGVGDDVIPVSHIRKAIAQHMLASTQTTARAWTMVEVNVDRLVKLRERAKDDFEKTYGVKLTYLPMVVRATVDALLAHPDVNARLDTDNIVRHRFVNMGIAVSYDAGLIVPVIRGADGMNTVGVARAIADLAARARAHQLRPDEVQGATFTITNPGPYGSVASVPIINQPNVGILSLDAIVKRPVVVEDAIAIRSMVNISMSWDHRVIDGELATRFLARVKQNLETWDFAEDLGLSR